MFIAKEFSLPQEPASCREVMLAPLVEDVQSPRPRPRSPALKKRGPYSAHALGAKLRRKRWRDVRKTRFQPRPQRAAKPLFPGQGKRPLWLPKNFLRQQPGQRIHQ